VTGMKAIARRAAANPFPLDVNTTIREVLALTRAEMLHNSIVVRVSLMPDQVTVLGDRIQLQQVLLNLMRNAMDAMKAVEGRLKSVKIASARGADGVVVVSVEDNGPGIDATSAAKIFEPLFTTKFDGMGMGLAICRSIVEAHSGKLWVEECSPNGARFNFAIPCEGAAI
jgi:C4-dicarboxylate-specific signal transduction histidine kinase